MKAQKSRVNQNLEWADMPYLLCVCEAGSLAGAARMLGVNHSTVFRRIEAVEKRLGVRLFERLARGYVMTPAGEHFYERGIQLCGGMDEIERELSGQDLRLEGPLTITTTDSLLHCLSSLFAQFQQNAPRYRTAVDVRCARARPHATECGHRDQTNKCAPRTLGWTRPDKTVVCNLCPWRLLAGRPRSRPRGLPLGFARR